MEEQFAALGMTVERFQATTPDTIADDGPAPFPKGKIDLSAPEIAISVSHFRVWRRMIAEGRRHVLVLEDDVRLSPLLPSFLAALDLENTDIGVLRLETRMSNVLLHARAEQAPSGFSLHLPLSYETGCSAYIISAAFASRILASPKRFSLPLDDILFHWKARCGMYGAFGSPFRRWQLSFPKSRRSSTSRRASWSATHRSSGRCAPWAGKDRR